MEPKQKCDYRMRAGFIIHTPAIDGGKVYTNANLTNEVAAKYLELFPSKRDRFEVIPEPKAEEPVEADSVPVENVKVEAEASVQPVEEKPKKAAKKRKKAKK